MISYILPLPAISTRDRAGGGKPPYPCCGRLTEPEDFVGGHVERIDDPNKIYICPVRNSCNSRYGIGKEDSPEFEVSLWDCEEIK